MKNFVSESPHARSGYAGSGSVLILFALLATLFTTLPHTVGAQSAAGPYLAAEHAARRGDISEAAQLYSRVLARDPNNVRLMEQTMLHQLAAGQVAQAIVVAQKLVQTRPGHGLGLLVLAADGLKDEQYAGVTEQLTNSDGNGDPYIRPLIDAWAAFGAGKPKVARAGLQLFETAEADSPLSRFLAAYHIGLFEAAVGNDKAADTALARAAGVLKNGGSTSRLTRARAGALARSGNLDAARALLQERLSKTFGDPRIKDLASAIARGETPPPEVATPRQGAADAFHVIASFIGNSNNWLIGLAYSRLAVYLDPELSEAQLLAGDFLFQNNQFELAIEAFARIPEDSPEALAAQIGRAEALRDAGDTEEGLSVLREIALRHPKIIEPHIALGDMLRQSDQFAEAATAYGDAIALIGQPERRHWALFYQRGIAHERAKQWPKAEADFLKALELEEDQPLVLNYLGYSWVEMRVNLEEALEMIKRAVEQRPEDGFIADSLGWVFYRLGKHQEALAPMARAVEFEPVDPTINDHYGDVLWMNGRKTEAEFQWKRALNFNPPEEGQSERIKRKLEFGLDWVLKEEAKAETPALAETEAIEGDGG